MAGTRVTLERLRHAEEDLLAARTADEVRQVFKKYYLEMGWKRLCRMFVLGRSADELVSDDNS